MLPKKGLCVLDFFPCYFLFSLKHVTSWIIKITICLYWSFWEVSQHNWSWWAIKDTICTCCLFMRVKYWWKCKSFKQIVFLVALSLFVCFFLLQMLSGRSDFVFWHRNEVKSMHCTFFWKTSLFNISQEINERDMIIFLVTRFNSLCQYLTNF